jgi:N-acyl-D-aspartate/D-glutamate deacylase
MRIPRRGVIVPGAVADIVVFDLERTRDKATYEDPHQLCEGMEYVLVNGRIAVDNGEFTAEMGGRVLTRGQP